LKKNNTAELCVHHALGQINMLLLPPTSC
jgi:hypothetical protein